MSYKDKFALEKRPDKGLLAGLYQFPLLENHFTSSQIQQKYEDAENIVKIESSKHIFTHLEWEIEAYRMTFSKALSDYIWVNRREMKEMYSIPNAFRKYKEMIQGGRI